MEKEKLEVAKTNTIFATDLVNKGSIMLNAWINGEGFEINLARSGGYQTISIYYSEFDLLKKMVKNSRKRQYLAKIYYNIYLMGIINKTNYKTK